MSASTPNKATPEPPAEPRQIDSTEILRGERAVVIAHSGEQYRLSVTRNGKLILQK
ncbi:hypothetical protein Mal64_09300 [Pseudobythopirellula maris]|uniref:Hemin uptake protein hemP n=1 Tax=Pseudobythopirellula maris TaxID=2527991 RepID=A0A5C5ZU45_9BACT|nr:hemin uptake protein HemP [Pseudobythopirellula maris]TWT90538.1 hypothetical protein Mal64_09300 [Pseudobythopirellula maris]